MIVRGRYIEALTAIHVRSGKPQDLTDDELREFGLMDDLVKRLREYGERTVYEMHEDREEAADRIEQLERELAAEKARLSDEEEYQGYRAVNADGQLYVHIQAHDDAWTAYKAEKALADQLIVAGANALQGYDRYDKELSDAWDSVCAAYRKARGL